ncbi:MAG: glycosyl transferase family 1, partial [Proteobacteria bacterium]|nr:glycosyl transferase family 1 [Pseudomonadota bacterium]
MSRKINIIGKTNGAELSRDLALLAHALRGAGHDVCIATMDELQARHRRSMLPHWRAFADPWRKRSGRLAPADVNLMLAHVWPQYLRTARTNIVIPAPERFDRYDRHLLPRLDGVWAKTQHAHELFTTLNCNTTLLGFDGIDRHRPEIPRERTFLHLADESRNSGTDQLLRLWARHPHWPPLTVVQCRPEPDIRAHNIVHLIDLAADAALEVLQNSHLFHLCLSQTEGWSHPIVEALSVGAVTIAM